MVAKDYSRVEKKYNIPYRLNDRPHMYAMDSLVLCEGLDIPQPHRVSVSKLYTVLFLFCSYFDDYVEHRDKFYRKFAFAKESDRSTQAGAVAFSTIGVFYELVLDYLRDASVPPDKQVKFLETVNSNSLAYTPFFTVEQDSSPTAATVLAIKQHNISGRLVAMLSDIVEVLGLVDEAQAGGLRKGLFYVGSLMQITDDLRDAETDKAMNNANLLNACVDQYGREEGMSRFVSFFEEDLRLAHNELKKVNNAQVMKVLSLPFYPFCIS